MAGTSDHAFRWEGHNWDGQSDTNETFGAPFPAGVYTLFLRSEGQYAPDAQTDALVAYKIDASIQILLTDD